MAGSKRMVLTINGMRYYITTDEDEAYVAELTQHIDKSLAQLMKTERTSANEGLVLLCLSYLDAYRKSEQGSDHLRAQIAEYLEEASKARQEALEAGRQIEKLEARLKEREKAGKH